jgi:hypothetical protein
MITTHTTVRLLTLVCALQQFYINHRQQQQQYPTSLDALIPSILNETPIDPMSGKTWNYRPSDNLQGFLLYSVGKNGVDEGGVRRFNRPSGKK